MAKSDEKIHQLDLLNFEFFQEHLEAISENEKKLSEMESSCLGLNMTPVEFQLIKTILQQTIEELAIVNRENLKTVQGMATFNLNDNQRTSKIRFNERIKKQIFFQPAIQIMKDALLDMIETKMTGDVEYIRRMLSDTLKMISTGSQDDAVGHGFQLLRQSVLDDLRDDKTEFELLIEYIKNKNCLSNLEEQLKANAKNGEKMLKELDDIIVDLDNEIHDIKIENSIKSRLVEKWETTRFEQEKMILANEEKNLTQMFDTTEEKINIEQRATNDIESFIKHKIETIDSLTAHWMEKYDKEVDQLDESIHKTNAKINEAKLKYETLSEIYEKRRVEMHEYWEKKRLEREALELEERKWSCAIRIQAWWRGTMVRKGFGRFRKRKGKGKPQKKNKK